MKGKKLLSAALSLALLPSIGMVNVSAASGTVVRLDPSNASPFNNGEFQGWGTSMGWWGNRLGHSDKMAQQAAEDLYSDEGLSLDIVRYNVGGGDHPNHNHINRSDSKLPCFAAPKYDGGEPAIDSDGKITNFAKDTNGDIVYEWDWDADHDQINVLTRIKEENPDVHIEGYTNSPPWFMTNSLCSSGGVNAAENLDPENYDVFADFLVGVAKHMEEIGLPFDSYSPMNEPNPRTAYWGALSSKQEGNHVAQGEHQHGLLKALKDAYTAENIDTLVAGPDETDIGYSINAVNAISSLNGLGSLDRIDTHTYGGSDRAGMKAAAIAAGKNLWMSEVDGNWNGFGLADRIIADLNGMQASAWVLWDLVDFHKDSNFVDPTTGNKTEANASLNVTGSMWGMGMGNHDTETVEWSNKYYAYGQFTRYIEPGDTIIASSNNTLAAYNKKSGDIKIVATNSSASDQKYTFDLSAFTNTGSEVKEIRTNNQTGNNAEHWKEITGEATLENKKISTTLKAGTITTYVVAGEGTTDYAVITGGANQIGLGSSVKLGINTNLTGDVEWSSSDEDIASVTQDGTVTAKASGTVTIYAKVGNFTTSRDFEIPMYTLTGTASWGNDSNRPADSADYKKAADGDLSTYFDGTTNGWVQYDFGSTFKINQIKLAARSGSGMPERTAGGRVQGSNDGITWTDIYKITSAIPAERYTTITADDLINKIPYRYYRYTNSANMANIAEFLIEGEPSSDMPAEISKFEADENKLSYSYEVSDELSQYQKYFAVYDSDNKLKYVSVDKNADEVQGDFSDCTFKLFVWDDMKPMNAVTDSIEPVITDLDEFTDNFESNDNIFSAPNGAISDGGNVVFASGLDRFGNVFAPVKATAEASLKEAKTLTGSDKFRLTFNMFAGWESSGKDNTFALKDADGNELVALYMTGGGYNFNQIRIGGENVLPAATVSQSRSNPGSSKAGANGWNASGQPYVNTVGYNKTVEITIDGTGAVSVSATGGMADTTVTGAISKPVTLGSIELTGDYNSAAERTVSYDNFDGDIITYANAFDEPEPTAKPTEAPEPTDAPVLPESGEIISLSFDNGD